MKTFHILNGDALKDQFPAQIMGEQIVMRECLIEGNIQGNSLEDFLDNRRNFLQEAYGVSQEEFEEKGITEINKILTLPATANVYLWFERDLFCQVNLWFTAFLLTTYTSVQQIFLILPTSTLEKGFGGMDEVALTKAFQAKQPLSIPSLKILAQLWQYYRSHQLTAMKTLAQRLSPTLPFLLPAVQAHIQRQSTATTLGHPERLLLNLQKEFPEKKFPAIFKEFSKRAAIYGFGDSQVYRLWKGIVNE